MPGKQLLHEMFGKKIGRVIPIRIRIPWRRDKSTKMLHDHSIAAGSCDVSARMTLPVVQATVEAIPVAGAPLKAAISRLLAVLQVKDRYFQNREDLDGLTYRLYNLSCHIANVPTAQSPSEEAN
ncbi:hypothetical protein EV401DRAFT_1884727 [Pisolithus croceorrhizus]|nr:hypothetical protein EV401DRAFT_1884727 [Pisolithus croceorrhizus]